MIHILIKPASGMCNLRCKYCFYHDVTQNREQISYGIMTEQTLENVIKKALEYSKKECTIAYQGGEPTLAGLDFFKKSVQLQKKHNKNKVTINNAIQTNGTLLDEAWAKFLGQNRFLVGLSLDGTKDTHDISRIGADGKGTFHQVMRAAELLRRHNVDFNILTVVNAKNARHARAIYNFFKKNQFFYLQFIPCLDPLDESKTEFSLKPSAYGEFLKTLFDLWYADICSGQFISIRQFDNYVQMLMGYPPESCGMSGVCSCQNVIEANGEVYPCDFYVLDRYQLGNLNDCNFDDINKKRIQTGFLTEDSVENETCMSCKFFQICRGGCKRYKSDENMHNCFCESYYAFFEYALPRMHQLAKDLSNRSRM